jgi:lipopolysaccharide export system permease protein
MIVTTLHKSILRELVSVFLITIAFLNSILMMEKLLRLSRILSGVGATVIDMAKIILYLQPQLLMLTIPMSLLLTTLLVYGRMNLDSEIIVMKAAGMDFRKISRPVFVLGMVCFLASLAVSFSIGPKSSVRLRNTISQVIAARSTLALEEGMFNTSFKDVVIIVKGKRSSDTLENIFIYDNRVKDEPKVLMAKEGKLSAYDGLNIGLYLTDGYINITRNENTTELFFEKYNMTLSIDAESTSPKKMEFTPLELMEQAKGADTFRKRAGFYLELHRRLSLPSVCLILVLLGPPLSLIAGKSGRLGGLALGLFVFVLFYMLLIYGENLAMAKKLPHYLGAWLSSIVLGVFAGIMFWRGASR